MNIVPLLQSVVFRIRTYLAAVLLRHDYDTNPALGDFNTLDGEDFVEVSDIRP